MKGGHMANEKQRVLGLALDALKMDDVIKMARAAIATRRRLEIGVVNAAKLVQARRDPALRRALRDCDILVADGQSIVWASRLLDRGLPERVAGIDIFIRLLEVADEEGLKVYLLGARPDVLQRLLTIVSCRYPNLVVSGCHDGYFTSEESVKIAHDIQLSEADMLFLGMPTPAKEIFISTWGPSLDVPLLHGVGGSFDVVAGVTKRASRAWQRLGLEWLVRLCQEPRRLWRRYLVTNAKFILMVAQELLARIRPTGSHVVVRKRRTPDDPHARGAPAPGTTPQRTEDPREKVS